MTLTKFLFSALLAFGLSAHAAPLTRTCAIQTYNGHYLTAVNGGGLTSDVIHSDATRVQDWERFQLIDSGDGSAITHYGIRTLNGHFLTAINGGGLTSDVLHSDATQLQDWEKFAFLPLGRGWYAIQTINGRYLTAVGAGGRTTDVIHTDTTVVKQWEMFKLLCSYR